ncbi:hypothetical protein Cgig2_005500 [Carnegiea gigantea]|uniref:FAD-binding PCMH-type domain-containing protein n=1 Tax=Carnegiea gigantea TaxID=171969 RepID=A0A9Q1KD72_9CARY|nr:hypothetical protein Cgig2_005500 [Carnegiea gigantea]
MYVKKPIPIDGLEGLGKERVMLQPPQLAFNPYGGRMFEIPGRSEKTNHHIDLIRKLYKYITPFVSKNPREAFFQYRDLDLGINHQGSKSYIEGKMYGIKYFKVNFHLTSLGKSKRSIASHPISSSIYTLENSSCSLFLQSYIRNLLFNTSTSCKPWLIVTATHLSFDHNAFIWPTLDVINSSITRGLTNREMLTFLLLGDSKTLLSKQEFRLLSLQKEDCLELSSIKCILFYDNFPNDTSLDTLLVRQPTSLSYLKRTSDYVKELIPIDGLEGLQKEMVVLQTPQLAFNSQGGRMFEIPGNTTTFPHRARKLFKVAYMTNWSEEGSKKTNHHPDLIRKLYKCITPFATAFVSSHEDSVQEGLIQCLVRRSIASHPISSLIYTPENSSYSPVLQSYIRNLRFNTSTTRKPVLIVTATHVSHVQASILCAQDNGIEMKVRSGGHDYEGLSYVSIVPFFMVDMFNLRSIDVNIEEETAWVEAGATLVSRTLDQNLTDIVDQYQHVAPNLDHNAFIRLTLDVTNSSAVGVLTNRATFRCLFLGDSETLLSLVNKNFPLLGLQKSDCLEMSWIESVLFYDDYPDNTPLNALLDRQPSRLTYLKRKSDYLKKPIPRDGLEGLWKQMVELQTPQLTFNPYGGRMAEIPADATPFPHRAGNLFKLQYATNWNEGGSDRAKHYIDLTRKLHTYMTPFVSSNPREAFLNYRDLDLGINYQGSKSYVEGKRYGIKYFKDNFFRLVRIKTEVDPLNFFRNEQSIPTLPH